jgi:hypothetical protein
MPTLKTIVKPVALNVDADLDVKSDSDGYSSDNYSQPDLDDQESQEFQKTAQEFQKKL